MQPPEMDGTYKGIYPNQIFGACVMVEFELIALMEGYHRNQPRCIGIVNELTAEGCPPETLLKFCRFVAGHKPGDGSASIPRRQLYAIMGIAVATLQKLVGDLDAGNELALSLEQTCIATGWYPRETLRACQTICADLENWGEWVTIVPTASDG